MTTDKTPVYLRDVEKIVKDLIAREVSAHDVKDILEAVVLEGFRVNCDMSEDALAEAVAAKVETLTSEGLLAQVSWMAHHYGSVEDLEWGLAGYLNLPEAVAA